MRGYRVELYVFMFPIFPLIADKNGGVATSENGIKARLLTLFVAVFLKKSI